MRKNIFFIFFAFFSFILLLSVAGWVHAICEPGYTSHPTFTGTMCCAPVSPLTGICPPMDNFVGGQCCHADPGGGTPAPSPTPSPMPSPTTPGITFRNPFGNVTFDEMLMRVLRWLWPLSITIALLMVIIGAYYLVFSGGDPQKAALGRKVVIYALIGLAIVTLARGIVALVRLILGITL